MRFKVTIGVNNIVLLYLLDDDGKLKHGSFCFTSDGNTQETNSVYMIQTKLVNFLKTNYANYAIQKL